MASPADLDFLDPANPFFVTDRVLFSCGPFLHGNWPKQGMFSKRPGVTILGDSGGFQFIGKPSLFGGDATRRWVLSWAEGNTDEAMTLDIPTAAIDPTSPWPDFVSALDCTVESLRYFQKYASGEARFLNVLQGRDKAEALAWYEAVKWFPGGGWAFGGTMRADFQHLVVMLRQMQADGLLGPDRNRVHVLGMADLKSAVALSAIQRGMRQQLGDDKFLITFDVSSPSVMTMSGQAFGFPALSPSSFGMTYWRPPSVVRPSYGRARWPILSSTIAQHIRMEDLNVPKSRSIAQCAWDALGYGIIVNHNVQSLLSGIEQANRVMELHPNDALALAPAHVVNSYQALKGACTARNPVAYLRPYAGDLARM